MLPSLLPPNTWDHAFDVVHLKEFIPVDGFNLRIVLPINSLFASHLEVFVGHAESGLSGQFCFHHGNKLFVMCNRNQLKVSLFGARGNDLSQRDREATFIGVIEIDSRLVKSNATEVDTKGFRQCKADHETGQHALSSAAPAAHIELGGPLHHDNSIVV